MKYTAPRLNRYERVVALLQCWAAWRGNVRSVMLRHMEPRCTLGWLVRAARQQGELWAHNEAPREIFDDELMERVDRIVAGLDSTLKSAVMETYVKSRFQTGHSRARRLRCSERAYWYRLERAHRILDRAIDWSRSAKG